jgi:hypothetical protein
MKGFMYGVIGEKATGRIKLGRFFTNFDDPTRVMYERVFTYFSDPIYRKLHTIDANVS